MWDHLPSADELLDARVAAGWQPTPTATRNGPVIMGHAACLLARAPAAASPDDEPPAR